MDKVYMGVIHQPVLLWDQKALRSLYEQDIHYIGDNRYPLRGEDYPTSEVAIKPSKSLQK